MPIIELRFPESTLSIILYAVAQNGRMVIGIGMVLKRILLLSLLCGALSGKAQSILDFRLNGSEQGKPLSTVLSGIEESTHARFFFLDQR